MPKITDYPLIESLSPDDRFLVETSQGGGTKSIAVKNMPFQVVGSKVEIARIDIDKVLTASNGLIDFIVPYPNGFDPVNDCMFTLETWCYNSTNHMYYNTILDVMQYKSSGLRVCELPVYRLMGENFLREYINNPAIILLGKIVS